MKTIFLLSILFLFSNCKANTDPTLDSISATNIEGTEVIVLGAGCFWCVEAVIQELKGVISVESGYSNGNENSIDYKAVCTGKIGYAEVAKITYNPDEISFETLLSVFFKTHDPTTLNRQGADVGTQYRSGIYLTEAQKKSAETIIKKLNKEKAYPNPILTEATQLAHYSKAENYLQDYYATNPNQGCCSRVNNQK